MTTRNTRISDRIQGWNNQQEQQCGSSNNMLRILERNIINSVKHHERDNTPNKLMSIRPATVRVRPSTSKQERNVLESYPTIDLCNLFPGNMDEKYRQKEEKKQGHMRQRNKSVCNSIKNRSKNKQNQYQKQFYSLVDKQKQKTRGEELQMKKQSLIFKNLSALKNKKVIGNFHEMQIKMRKNRLQFTKAIPPPQNVHIVVESHRKGTEIKIGRCNINMELVTEQNLFQLGLEKSSQTNFNYTKLSRKNKLVFRDKENRRKQVDAFTDAHLAEPKGN